MEGYQPGACAFAVGLCVTSDVAQSHLIDHQAGRPDGVEGVEHGNQDGASRQAPIHGHGGELIVKLTEPRPSGANGPAQRVEQRRPACQPDQRVGLRDLEGAAEIGGRKCGQGRRVGA